MALPTRVIRNQGVDPFEATQRDFNHLLVRLLNGQQQDGGGRLAPYGVDVREDGDHIYVEAELPGFKKDDVNITLENNTLTIAAERKEDARLPDGNNSELLHHERRYTRFLRSFTLPPTVDEQTVNAKLQDGMLIVTLNKREETKPRQVQVN